MGNYYMCTCTELKAALNEVLSPCFFKMGFQYDGGYYWYSPWKNHMRKVICASLMKGYSILSWGIIFDFLPIPSGNTLKYNRTDKNLQRHLFTYPKPFIDYQICSDHHMGMFGENINDVYRQIRQAFSLNEQPIKEWFGKIITIEDALSETEYQLNYGKYYRIHSPKGIYVKAFLLSVLGKYDEGKLLLEQYLLNRENIDRKTKDKLMDKLKEVNGFISHPK